MVILYFMTTAIGLKIHEIEILVDTVHIPIIGIPIDEIPRGGSMITCMKRRTTRVL